MIDDDLPRRFEALTGFPPYLWQARLYDRFVQSEPESLPQALDLPTGLGKTSVMALWLCARLAGADLPRRLIYVVDRRAVVDQATKEAEKLARNLDLLLDGPDRETIIRRLGFHKPPKSAGGEEQTWLPISTLRGQFLDNRRWFEDPSATAIVVGTVDMIGSRLLFSGYGVSRGMRPVHAGLIGVDSLVVVDEAHLVPPFEAMLRSAAAQIEDDSKPPIRSSMRVLSLSATGRLLPGAKVFRLTDAEREEPAVAARLSARKDLHIHAPIPLKGAEVRLADEARRLGEGGARVIVFTNSRDLARKVAEELEPNRRKKPDKAAEFAELLVGERRYAERVRLTGDKAFGMEPSTVFARFVPGAAPDPLGRPAYLVATSAGEVGVDLDADHLVCDLVAWERMVQRLGRVNRRAEPGQATVAVFPIPFKDKEGEDVVLDDDLARYHAVFDGALWPPGEGGGRDASPGRLGELKDVPGLAPMLEAATTPTGLRPPLTRAVVDAWSLTSLREHTGRPLVAPWLRGWDKQEPQTTVAWRRWFPVRSGAEGRLTPDVRAYFKDFAPIHLTETLDAPTWRVAALIRELASRWLKVERRWGGRDAAEPEETDEDDDPSEAATTAEAAANDDAPVSEPEPRHAPLIVALASDGSVTEVLSVNEIAAFRTTDPLERLLAHGSVVIDARMGGLDPNGLLDAKTSTPPATIDMQRDGWRFPLDRTWARKVVFGKADPEKQKPKDWRWKLSEFRWTDDDGDNANTLTVELWRGPGRNAGDAAIAARPQGLSEHLSWTGKHAFRIADALGLAEEHRAVLVAAAEAHDLGKDRELWQNAMNAPRPPKGTRPYAKTTGGGDGRALNGYRHEFGSVREVLEQPVKYLGEKGVTTPALQDLALHLILAHHGRARPTVNAYDPDQLPSASAPLAREAALRFARLQAAWGPWGLAWWEALLRAADWAASRELNEAAAGIDDEAQADPADGDAALEAAAGAARG